MITIDSMTINCDMYLKGVGSALQVLVQQDRDLNGDSHILVSKINKGRSFTLGTQSNGSAIQGLWTLDEIENLKVIEGNGLPVVLDYRGNIYNVIITSISEPTPFKINEVESASKRYTTIVNILEV